MENALLIFDYDGVIFDTKNIAYEIVKEECRKHCKSRIKSMREFTEMYRRNFYDAMRKRGVSISGLKKVKSESIALLSKKRLKIHPGIKSVLKKLSKSCTLAVISSNYDSIIKRNLRANGILQCFRFIMGTEEGESKRIKIKSLLKKSGFGKNKAVFITDTIGDIAEAKSAGIMSIGVTWGFQQKKVLLSARPDFIVSSPEQIEKVV